MRCLITLSVIFWPSALPAAVFSMAAVARRWKVEMLRIISTDL